MEDALPARPGIPKRRRAQSLVELGLILPTFMLITLGVVDLGRAFYQSIALHGAAEAGSMVALEWRRASAPSTVAEANTAVRDAVKASTNPDIFPFLQIQDSDIDLTQVPWTSGTQYAITVNHNFQLMTPLLSRVFSGNQNFTLTAAVRGRHNCPCS